MSKAITRRELQRRSGDVGALPMLLQEPAGARMYGREPNDAGSLPARHAVGRDPVRPEG